MPWELKNMVNNFALTLGMAALALLIPIVGARYVLPNLPKKVRVISTTTLRDAHSHASPVVALGSLGQSKTPLHPTGKAVFNEVTIEVSSRGEFIEAGKAVEVCQIQGPKIVVRPVEGTA
jgi:membrane-bound serine protease (ClpP class)